MNLLTKFKSKRFNIFSATPSIVCTVFEDNNCAINIVNVPKMRACIISIHSVYHYFLEHIINKKILIKPIDKTFKMADVFTKLLHSQLFLHHRTAMQYVISPYSARHKERKCANTWCINMHAFTPINIY